MNILLTSKNFTGFISRPIYFNDFNDKNISDLGVMKGDERLYFIGMTVFSQSENSKLEISFAMAIFACICANLQKNKYFQYKL